MTRAPVLDSTDCRQEPSPRTCDVSCFQDYTRSYQQATARNKTWKLELNTSNTRGHPDIAANLSKAVGFPRKQPKPDREEAVSTAARF